MVGQLGLDHLIAQDGKAAKQRMARQRPEDFDPLLCAWQMIVKNAGSQGILDCMGCGGEEHLKTCTKTAEECAARAGYLALAVRDTRTEAIRLGYTPRELS